MGVIGAYDCGTLAYSGYLTDLNTLPNMNLERSWWDQNANEDLAILNKLFFTAGDISLTYKKVTHCILFNKELIVQYPTLQNPYELVENDNWTFDTFAEEVKKISEDLNANQTADKEDRFGLMSWNDPHLAVITASGEKILTVKDDGTGDVSDDDTSVDTSGGTDTSDAKKYTINSISDLNKNAEIDSHANSYQHSSLERNFRESNTLKSYDLLNTAFAMYPRVKKISDDKYFLIFQSGQYGGNIMFSTSKDGVNFDTPRVILKDEKILDGTDTRRYMTADAAVLPNGDILIVSSFRAVSGYRTMVGENGLVSIRSTDGGKTWSEKKVIYVGTNWEPYVFVQKSGEIQVYFSATAEKIYLYGYSNERISSGIGMIRSTDNGETWTPDIKEAPYAPQYVMKQYVTTRSDGVKCFTDQMASAVELNNGSIALVGESRFPGTGSSDVYKISVGISKDNWATRIGFDESGPSIRSNNMFLGAGPYIAQFTSGETLLTYNQGNTFYARLGSADALNYADAMSVFEVGGFWGSCLMDSDHSAILTSPAVTSSNTANINVARFYLNHDVNAQKLTPTIDGGNEEWSAQTDALFIGSKSQAQVSFRFAYDDEYIYILAERLDNSLFTGDSISVMLSDSSAKGFYNLKCDLNGQITFEYFDGSTRTAQSTDGVEVALWLDGTLDAADDNDTGAIIEMKIPRRYAHINDGLLGFNAIVYNKDKQNEKATSDTFSLADSVDKTTWHRIIIK